MKYNKLKWKKNHTKCEDIEAMTPKAIILLGIVLQFCGKNDLDCVITNVRTRFPESVSNTHPEGRAFDVRTRNWSDRDIKNCLQYVKRRGGHIGAFTKRNGKLVSSPAVYHDIGLGEHIHFQVRR